MSQGQESCNPKSQTMHPCAAESPDLTSDQLFDVVFSNVPQEGGTGSGASSSGIQRNVCGEADAPDDLDIAFGNAGVAGGGSHGDESVVPGPVPIDAVAAVAPESADVATSEEPMPASHRGISGPRGPNVNSSPSSLADVSPPGCTITLNCSLLESCISDFRFLMCSLFQPLT